MPEPIICAKCKEPVAELNVYHERGGFVIVLDCHGECETFLVYDNAFSGVTPTSELAVDHLLRELRGLAFDPSRKPPPLPRGLRELAGESDEDC